MAKSEEVQSEPEIETKIEEATPLADTKKGEISPAADQSTRGDEIAARMAVTPVKTKPAGDNLTPEQKAILQNGGKIINEDGEEEFVDPDDLGSTIVTEEFPRTICVNCRNHGRGDVTLNDRGFCKRCGFKLNRVHNTALEPAQK